ncbi:MAG: fructose-1,6-bisphosphatase [Oscillospiraceae bacterium]|nr:fructose-1,6-bisphosphatase [Oscillospiraceae bacterium]
MAYTKSHYLEPLAEIFPTIGRATTEIINLQSVLNLPKGTEHFLSDIHGEYEAFSHVLRNGSGAVRKKIDDVFGHTLGTNEKIALASLIYYPKERMELIKDTESDMENWYRVSLYRLIEVCKVLSSKYTREKLRRALPRDYAYVIEELITEKPEVLDKKAYYDSIVDTIIEIGCAENFIVTLSRLIQHLVIDHLHIIGDIYDRGSGSHFIMDRLCSYHSLDIQWGNHDVVWMGAASGQTACIAAVVRNSLLCGNYDTLEDGYGISLMPLARFALEVYSEDPCSQFKIRGKAKERSAEVGLAMRMHKAIAVIQFKLDGQLEEEYPEFGMEDRRLLHKMDLKKGTVEIDGREYELLDRNFPTIDPENPYELTEGEKAVIKKLQSAFVHCEKLQRHIQLLLKKGGLYKIYNGNLLYHGCVPMNEDGSFREVSVGGKKYKGRMLYDVLESYVRKAFVSLSDKEKKFGRDIMWFLWNGPDSPLFGRSKMANFERYFVKEEETHREVKNPYYSFMDDTEAAERILKEFGLESDNSHIINGHVPVHQKEGESPVKCGGKLLVIDGGFSKQYRSVTGIAGYTLIYNSYGLMLTAHEPFESKEKAVSDCSDIVSRRVAVEHTARRISIGDTDEGARIKMRIADLKSLIDAYRKGIIQEHDD